MKKLSSGSTFFYKRIFPAIWFGFIIFFIITTLYADRSHSNGGADVMLFIVPVFLAVVGYFIMKNLVFDLIDEVYDEGSSLLFKNKGKSVRVNLADIKNISYSVMVNPPRVTISLRHKTEFGDELSFSPPASLIPFKKNKDISDLIDRIDQARG
ncbi:MAG: hypothetical protein CVU43_24510 [Chloroflexi bacterium HGW-Chloroflexi-5]|jgi:hypothetical protein|nr:MAG: hypothetical protein CVU55_14145 [Deltaproteobacteria bacterium HGW-Deltaproteobacteria-13]PKN95068.1 MAG: hypothetical protein CVU43_24510 [Chloroflexi bacterium HGW-Chloroflexi-5]